MRLAAIDIGTNSVHMIVVQVHGDLSFEVIDREKEMVRLGAGGLDGRALTDESMAAALQVLSKFKRLAESHQVDQIVAVATSATREAENGGAFLKAITQQTGIRAHVISGNEEARLIHLAAAYGVGISGDTAVVVDIGGGSVEVTRGIGPNMELGKSFKVGVIRLTERFVKSDPISRRDERKLVKHLDTEFGDYLRRIAKAGFDRVIGTSGTILSLGTVAEMHAGQKSSGLRNRRVPVKHLHRLRKALTSIDLPQRLQFPGLDPKRADIAVAGAVLLDTILKRLGATEMSLCDLSLREGVVLDYIAKHRKEIAQADRYPDVRRRSVVELAERCNYWPDHSHQIARLSLQLFDRTRGIHGLTDREREWLEYGAILHDAGVHISYERHHHHSYYLIKNR
jgi:exopolyphosphatase / guanosine-5'-triphosphate,3'-diphosphate pyrophosphatase